MATQTERGVAQQLIDAAETHFFPDWEGNLDPDSWSDDIEWKDIGEWVYTQRYTDYAIGLDNATIDDWETTYGELPTTSERHWLVGQVLKAAYTANRWNNRNQLADYIFANGCELIQG